MPIVSVHKRTEFEMCSMEMNKFHKRFGSLFSVLF